MSYTIKFLRDAEFDMLPYKHVKEALGCADPKTKVAYVRQTGIRPLDMFVTEHELEELVAKISPHEEDGIRYKKFKDIAAQIIPGLVGLVSGGFGVPALIGAGLGAASRVGTSYGMQKRAPSALDVIGGGLSGYGGAKFGGGFANPGTQATIAGTPGVTSNLSGVVNVAPTLGQRFAGGASALMGGGGVGQVGGASKAQIATGAGVPKTGLPWQEALKMGPQAGQAATTYAPPAAAGGGVAAGGGLNTEIPQNPWWKKVLGIGGKSTGAAAEGAPAAGGGGLNLGRIATGMAIPLIGGAFGKENQTFTPMDSKFFQDLSAKVQSGAQVPLTEEQRTAITANYDNALEDARENLKRYYKGIRPGSDIENDSDYRAAVQEMERDYAEQKGNAITLTQLGLTQQQVDNLSSLAAMDIYTLARNSQISVDEARMFKQMLSELGIYVATSGDRRSSMEEYLLKKLYPTGAGESLGFSA